MNDEQEKRRILIVDDDMDFAEGLVDILEPHGCELAIANGSKEAKEKIKKFDAEVALIDIRLGPTDGLTLIKHLRRVRPDLLCITMTAYAAKETAIEALRVGAYDYLRKPLNGEDLLATLERCFEKCRLERERALSEKNLEARNQELNRLNQRLRGVVESVKSMSACSDDKKPASSVLKEFTDTTKAGDGRIYIRNGDKMVLAESLGSANAPSSFDLPLPDDSAISQVLSSGKPLLIENVETEENLSISESCGYKKGSVLLFPILGDGRDIIGVVILHNKAISSFSAQDLDLGMILASLSLEVLRPC